MKGRKVTRNVYVTARERQAKRSSRFLIYVPSPRGFHSSNTIKVVT